MSRNYSDEKLQYWSLDKLLRVLEGLGWSQARAIYVFKDQQQQGLHRADAERLIQHVLKRFGQCDRPVPIVDDELDGE